MLARSVAIEGYNVWGWGLDGWMDDVSIARFFIYENCCWCGLSCAVSRRQGGAGTGAFEVL